MKSDLFITPWLVNTLLHDFDSQEEFPSSSDLQGNKHLDSISFPNEVPDNTNLSITSSISSNSFHPFRVLFSILKRGESPRNLQLIQFLRLPANPKNTSSDWIFLVTDHEYSISANFSLEALDALNQSHPDIPFSHYEGLFLSIETCQFSFQSDGYFHLQILQCTILKKKHRSSIRTTFPNILKYKQVRKLRWDLFRLLSSATKQTQETTLLPIITEAQPPSTALLFDQEPTTSFMISQSPPTRLIQTHEQSDTIPSENKVIETLDSSRPFNSNFGNFYHIELPFEALDDIEVAIDVDMLAEIEKDRLELESFSSNSLPSIPSTNQSYSIDEIHPFISISNTPSSILNESTLEMNTFEPHAFSQSNHSFSEVLSSSNVTLSVFDVSNPIQSGNTTDLSSNITSISEEDSSFPCTWPLQGEDTKEEEGPVHKKFIILE